MGLQIRRLEKKRKNESLLLENGLTDEGNYFGDHVISGILGLKPWIRNVKHFFGRKDHKAFEKEEIRLRFGEEKMG